MLVSLNMDCRNRNGFLIPPSDPGQSLGRKAQPRLDSWGPRGKEQARMLTHGSARGDDRGLGQEDT